MIKLFLFFIKVAILALIIQYLVVAYKYSTGKYKDPKDFKQAMKPFGWVKPFIKNLII